jgi:hypothetical protein
MPQSIIFPLLKSIVKDDEQIFLLSKSLCHLHQNKAKLSVCLTNYALYHEGIWEMGV